MHHASMHHESCIMLHAYLGLGSQAGADDGRAGGVAMAVGSWLFMFPCRCGFLGDALCVYQICPA